MRTKGVTSSRRAGPKESRLAKLRAAKEAIEEEAKEKAAQKAQERAKDQGASEEKADAARPKRPRARTPTRRAQRSFTDPERRMMKTTTASSTPTTHRPWSTRKPRSSWPTRLSNQASDAGQLMEMIDVSETNLDAAGIEENFACSSTDAGYFSEQNVNDATKPTWTC